MRACILEVHTLLGHGGFVITFELDNRYRYDDGIERTTKEIQPDPENTSTETQLEEIKGVSSRATSNRYEARMGRANCKLFQNESRRFYGRV